MDMKALREKLEEDHERSGRTPSALQAMVVKFSEHKHWARTSQSYRQRARDSWRVRGTCG